MRYQEQKDQGTLMDRNSHLRLLEPHLSRRSETVRLIQRLGDQSGSSWNWRWFRLLIPLVEKERISTLDFRNSE